MKDYETMLTQSDDLGNWSLKGVRWNQLYVGCIITTEIYEKLYAALFKLHQYEETGHTPDDIEIYMQQINAQNRPSKESLEREEI